MRYLIPLFLAFSSVASAQTTVQWGATQDEAVIRAAFEGDTQVVGGLMADLEGWYDADLQGVLQKGSYTYDEASSEYHKLSSPVVTDYPFYVSGWAKHSGTGARAVFALSDEASNSNWWGVLADVGGFLRFTADAGSDQEATTVNAPASGTWFHFFVAANSATDRVVVLDGAWADRGTSTGSATPSGLDNTTLAALERTTVGSLLPGEALAVALWQPSSALTSTQQQNLATYLSAGGDPDYVSAYGLDVADRVARWQLDNDATDSWGANDLTASGTPVANDYVVVWRDASGHDRHVLATTAAPDYSASASNGRDGVTFDDAASEFLEIDGDPWVTAAPFSRFVAAQTNDTSLDQGVINVADKDNDADYWSLDFAGATDNKVQLLTPDSGTSSRATTTTAFSRDTTHILSGVEASASSRAVRIDGGSEGTDSTTVSPDASDRARMGIRADSTPSAPLSGDIYWVVVYSADTDTDGRSTPLEGLGADRWQP